MVHVSDIIPRAFGRVSLRQWFGDLLQRWVKAGGVLVPILVTLVAMSAAWVAVHQVTFLTRVEQYTADVRTSLLIPSEPQDPNITIVALDEPTLAQFPYRSPVDRGFLAEIINRIASYGPRAIGLDVLFDQETEPEKDEALRRTLHDLKVPLVVSYIDTDLLSDDQREYLDKFVPPDARVIAALGEDPFDTARWINPGNLQPDGSYMPGFARALVGKLGIQTKPHKVTIAWHGQPANEGATPFAQISASWVNSDPVRWAKLLKNRIVLIGAVESLIDRHRTPFSAYYEGIEGQLPGIVIHAHGVAQLLEGRPSDEVPWTVNFAIVLGLAALGTFLGRMDLQIVMRVGAAGLIVGGIAAAGFLLFNYNRAMIELLTPSLALAMAMWMSDSLMGREARQQREYIKGTFSKYVSPKIVDQLIVDPKALELNRRPMTLMFTDVASFTTLSEAVPSEVLSRVLNTYLDGACQVILEYDGTIDKFIGDAIFSIYNAPLPQPDHQERAVKCAIALDAYAEKFRAEQVALGIPFGVTRIGINTGDATIGNFGSADRKEYTALGDPVNTASRLEGLNKYLGTRVCVSDTTREGCPSIKFRKIGLITLKGKTQGTMVFEPLSDEEAASDFIRRYKEAYERLKRRDPDSLALFEALHAERPEDGPVQLHLERLRGGETGAEIHMTDK